MGVAKPCGRATPRVPQSLDTQPHRLPSAVPEQSPAHPMNQQILLDGLQRMLSQSDIHQAICADQYKLSGREAATLSVDELVVHCRQSLATYKIQRRVASPFGYSDTSVGGSMNWKVAPRPAFAPAHRRPPCNSTIVRLIDSPRPVPSGFFVKNASKTWSIPPAGRPMPVSLTETRIWPSSAVLDETVNSPPALCIASMPLIIRLITTCCSCTKSTLTMGNSESSFV